MKEQPSEHLLEASKGLLKTEETWLVDSNCKLKGNTALCVNWKLAASKTAV